MQVLTEGTTTVPRAVCSLSPGILARKASGVKLLLRPPRRPGEVFAPVPGTLSRKRGHAETTPSGHRVPGDRESFAGNIRSTAAGNWKSPLIWSWHFPIDERVAGTNGIHAKGLRRRMPRIPTRSVPAKVGPRPAERPGLIPFSRLFPLSHSHRGMRSPHERRLLFHGCRRFPQNRLASTPVDPGSRKRLSYGTPEQGRGGIGGGFR